MTNSKKLIDYWKAGTAIIENQLAEAVSKAESPDWYSHAPIGSSPDGARGWHAGKIDSLRHALEMMGWSEETEEHVCR